MGRNNWSGNETCKLSESIVHRDLKSANLQSTVTQTGTQAKLKIPGDAIARIPIGVCIPVPLVTTNSNPISGLTHFASA